MKIDEFRDEIKQAGLESRENDILGVIYRVGGGQDVAWRENEGILHWDVHIDEELSAFLIPQYVIEGRTYQNYIFRLTDAGREIFVDYLDECKIDPQFTEIIQNLNPYLVTIIGTEAIRIDELHSGVNFYWFAPHCFSSSFNLLRYNSQYGDLFYTSLMRVAIELKKIHQNPLFAQKYTEYNSRRIIGKTLVLRPEYRKEFSDRLTVDLSGITPQLDNLSEEIKLMDNLIESHHEMSYFQIVFCEHLLDELEKEQIITKKTSKPPYFEILKEDEYRKFIRERIQEKLDEVTTPIIKEILGIDGITRSGDTRTGQNNVERKPPESISGPEDNIEKIINIPKNQVHLFCLDSSVEREKKLQSTPRIWLLQVSPRNPEKQQLWKR
ncbi:MAG: hypothetical protein ACXQTN_06520 [Methanoculleaceae archaeon]